MKNPFFEFRGISIISLSCFLFRPKFPTIVVYNICVKYISSQVKGIMHLKIGSKPPLLILLHDFSCKQHSYCLSSDPSGSDFPGLDIHQIPQTEKPAAESIDLRVIPDQKF